MRERPPAERQRLALEQGGGLHPQYTTEFETAFSVSWPRVPWNRGSWLKPMRLMPRSRRFDNLTAVCFSRGTT